MKVQMKSVKPICIRHALMTVCSVFKLLADLERVVIRRHCCFLPKTMCNLPFPLNYVIQCSKSILSIL